MKTKARVMRRRSDGGTERIVTSKELTDEIPDIFERKAQDDSKLQLSTWADRKLISVYGDTILHGQLTTEEDKLYQELYWIAAKSNDMRSTAMESELVS